VAWLALNSRNSQDRVIRMALITMAANLGGVTAPQILRANDAPLYRTGWTNLTIIVACGFFFALLLVVVYATLDVMRSRRDPEGMGRSAFSLKRGSKTDQERFATDGVQHYHY
jgi:sugar phosphate permease